MKLNYLSVKEGTPASGYWDQTFLEDLFAGIPGGDRDVFVIPGAYQGKDPYYSRINDYINLYKKVMVIITSDEEGNFDVSQLKHPDMIIYSQYGTSENILPLGYAPGTRETLIKLGPVEKKIHSFFSGQITHIQRQQMANVLDGMQGGIFLPTDGFAKGLAKAAYMVLMNMSKTAAAPPGPISHDSFRLYEALEAGTIPLATKTAPGGREGFWEKLFPDAPFPIVGDYHGYIFEGWTQAKANKVFAWWIAKKQEIKNKLRTEVGATPFATTVVIPTSPIPSHPSTDIIRQTIESVRHWLDCEIIIAIDGVRPEQEHMREQYDQYVRNLLWECNYLYKNVRPILFDTHKHQSGMMREVLPKVTTPLILFMEHDTPLVTDEEIDFPYLQTVLLEGQLNLIRLHFEAIIPDPHKHLMVGEPKDFLQNTIQWSQRPHLARKDYYYRIMGEFTLQANCFIEDRMHTVVQSEGWEKHKLAIYYPDPKNIKRSLNLDGRGSDRKFEAEQIW